MNTSTKQAWPSRIVGYGNEAPDQLLSNEKNARIHPKHQADALQGVLSEIGWIQDVIVNKRTSSAWGHNQGVETLVDGHLRVMIALRKGELSIPVKYVDLSPGEEDLALASFDPLSAAAVWDKEKLDDLLRDVSTGDAAVQQLLADLAEQVGIPSVQIVGAGGDDFDVDTALEGECRVQFGDIWTVGGVHRVCCGDSTDAATVTRLMDGERAALCFTSPPYNVASESSLPNKDKYRADRQNTFADQHDDRSQDAYLQFISLFTALALEYSDYVFVNVQSVAGNKTALIDYLYAFKDRYADTLIWDKQTAEPAMAHNVLNSRFEYIHVFSRKANRAIGSRDFRGTLDNVFSLNSRQDKQFSNIHRATFPLDLPVFFLENFCNKGALILDSFIGTGTTLIAAHRTQRRCYGIEIEPRYASVVLARAEAEGLSADLTDRFD